MLSYEYALEYYIVIYLEVILYIIVIILSINDSILKCQLEVQECKSFKLQVNVRAEVQRCGSI